MNQNVWIITTGIAIGASLWLALSVADKRKIGKFWGLFFCICFTPIFGAIFIFNSPKKDENIHISKSGISLRFISGIILIIIGVLVILGYCASRSINNSAAINGASEMPLAYSSFSAQLGEFIAHLFLYVGLPGWGIYLLKNATTYKRGNSL
ncbi:hypothetical protein [Arachidicoccus sp.]|uniref:hypothetical protein n=1 Tax=Arachidicoccus sp. TaxID=1872624 RepID=UPI003D206DFE